MANKDKECDCIKSILKCNSKTAKVINEKVLNGKIVKSERPDFIIYGENGVNIVLEHFLVDTVCQGNNSINRTNEKKINKLVKKYSNEEVFEEDLNNGTISKTVEDFVNLNIKTIYDFQYKDFIENLTRIFNNHYQRINCYIKNEYIKGTEILKVFLIELLIPSFAKKQFVLHSDNKRTIHRLNGIPFSTDMLKLFNNAVDLDLIIIAVFETSCDIKKELLNLYLITPKDGGNFSDKNIFTCDYFEFSHPTIRAELKLNIVNRD